MNIVHVGSKPVAVGLIIAVFIHLSFYSIPLFICIRIAISWYVVIFVQNYTERLKWSPAHSLKTGVCH